MEQSNHFFVAVLRLVFLVLICCSQLVNGQRATEKCLIVSDIHFAPLYGSTDPSLQSKLEKASFDEWKKYFNNSAAQMALDAGLYGQDANYEENFAPPGVYYDCRRFYLA
jgi:hypothetical protein